MVIDVAPIHRDDVVALLELESRPLLERLRDDDPMAHKVEDGPVLVALRDDQLRELGQVSQLPRLLLEAFDRDHVDDADALLLEVISAPMSDGVIAGDERVESVSDPSVDCALIRVLLRPE